MEFIEFFYTVWDSIQQVWSWVISISTDVINLF